MSTEPFSAGARDVEALKAAKFRGQMRFADGTAGMAEQDHECVDDPRFGYRWRREDYDDKGRVFYTVDGREVADLDEAARLLAQPADTDSPRERMRRIFADPDARREWLLSNEAQNHAGAGPFGLVHASMRRSSHPWHVGINRFQDAERAAGREWQSWLYDAKHAAEEAYRLMLLWRRDRDDDTGLRCILGQACRTCPMLTTIEAAMVESRTPRPGAKLPGYDTWDSDIDMAKTWTCITHILGTHPRPWASEGFLHTDGDRRHHEAESRQLARMSDMIESGELGRI